ncbi:MAG: hypothetical protein LZF60_30042 [Nitrospira sp.]|nr:MAG: hypothetical protein LZF60_30042 [Nitrospira sp.]
MAQGVVQDKVADALAGALRLAQQCEMLKIEQMPVINLQAPKRPEWGLCPARWLCPCLRPNGGLLRGSAGCCVWRHREALTVRFGVRPTSNCWTIPMNSRSFENSRYFLWC